MNTGIVYHPIPEPRLQLVKPQQSLDYKYQIEQDFSLRYRHFTEDEFEQIFSHLNPTDAHRYKTHYENLHQNVLQSMLKTIDIDEEIVQIKHSIKYTNEILPILIQNHQLAKREKKILYRFVTTTWQRFDERIQTEINVQDQLEHIKKEHHNLLKIKIQQEQYQKFYLQLQQINHQIIYLKREIQQLIDYKHQLQTELDEIQTHCTHNLIQVDYLKSTLLRHHTHQLNHLQLERDSIITETELIKYNLFEQMQEYEHIVRNYRQSLTSFRLTIHELEQQLKQQTDIELNHLQISSGFQRQTIHDDSEKLIVILETRIDEKKVTNSQLEKSIDHYHEKLLKQKHLLIKKENDYQAMDQIDQQLNHNINIYREIYLQLKTERRTIDRQLTMKLKEYTNEDRLHHTLIQQHESLLARKKIEQIRLYTSTEQLYPLIDENTRLKNSCEQLHQQYTKINPKHLVELREKILQLKEIHQSCLQEKINDEYTRMNYQNVDEKFQRKNNRISFRINQILQKFKQTDRHWQENHLHLQILENQLNEEQHLYLQEKYLLKQMKNRVETHQTKQNLIQKQLQIASNNIQQSQYRLKTFTEQLFMNRNDFSEHELSLNKLREFYVVLKEQDERNLQRYSHISLQRVYLQKQYKFSEKSLQQRNDDLMKYSNMRSILGRMVVRRVDLCQLLYRKLARSDRDIHQREENIQMINKCINSLKIQIRQIRNENKRLLQRKDQVQLETVKAHVNKMRDHSHQKQQILTEQIFQRHYSIKHSLDRLPTEEFSYLNKKFYFLKTRLIKMIFRGMICNLVLLSIQQEFTNQLDSYSSQSHRHKHSKLNSLRANLYQIMRQLKAKSAETNMLMDYQYYFEFIHADTIQQLTQ